jgi:nucleoside-diphosphate-sugar epimerase
VRKPGLTRKTGDGTAPGLATPAVTFNGNITTNFNVFQAAASLDLSRVVWASSETTLGLPFDVPPRGKFGTLLAIDRARKVLGFEPRHSWRDHVQA